MFILFTKIIWWAINIVWLLIFSALAVFIGVRNIDAAGMVQTPAIKMVSFIILGIVFLVVMLIQLIFLYFIRKSNTKVS
ncbi:DUF3923 family protein [Lysinibacillus sp. FSL L8-0126]|uniref:DUF3923 family protein n=1 Tax=Lysinibacillus sp. FSL L8-0126 TaxID=2921515 RepID=UPI003159CB74